jgi:hypothetical protein
MTAHEKIKQAMQHGPTPDSIDGLICLAYYIGREAAARTICDEHNRRIAAMRAQADAEHCRHVAHRVIDAAGGDSIYSGDYAGDVTATFGADEVTA